MEENGILEVAKAHIGEPYVLGARAPMSNAGWQGPWDCAEFVTWCVYQASGKLYGCKPETDPMLADAYTGFWAEQSLRDGARISVEKAARIPGAAVLRAPKPRGYGHIVISDGQGGTVEAHSKKRGVIAFTLSGRRWDTGILVPGVSYTMNEEHARFFAPGTDSILRLTSPLMRGPRIKALQERLLRKGYYLGVLDGIYGPQTAYAVACYQEYKGLVVDGEAGPITLGPEGVQLESQ